MFKGLAFFIRSGWKYDKRYVLWGMLRQLVDSGAAIALVLLPGALLDELLGARRMAWIGLYALLFAGTAALAAAAHAYLANDGFTRRCSVNAQFDAQLHKRLANADLCCLESPIFQDMQKKAVKFLYCDWHGFGYLLDCALDIVGQCIALAGYAAVLASVQPLVLALLISMAGAAYFAQTRAKRRAVELSMQVTRDQRRTAYFGGLFEDMRCAKEIRVGGAGAWLLACERRFMRRAVGAIGETNRAYMRAGFIGAAADFVQRAAICATLTVRAGRGLLTAGAFTMQLSAVTAFAAGMHRALESVAEIRAYDAYYDALDEYLQIPARLRGGKRLPVPEGAHRIAFERVSFRYPGQEKWALQEVSLVLEPGMRLMLVGENGAGKTTLVKLLTRLYAPTQGRILLDGVDIADLDADAYWALFATVFQDFQLFELPLRDNLTLGRQVPEERLVEALENVGLGPRLRTLPQGLDTYVGREFSEGGFQPSGGEAQKLALARALCREAPIAVLDEPTAALDPRAEQEMFAQFEALVRGRTAVFISHRLSSARFCDKIAVLDGGRLVQMGSHEELMREGGVYRELFEMQARNYRE